MNMLVMLFQWMLVCHSFLRRVREASTLDEGNEACHSYLDSVDHHWQQNEARACRHVPTICYCLHGGSNGVHRSFNPK